MQVDLKQHYDNAGFSITMHLLHGQFTSVSVSSMVFQNFMLIRV